MGYTSIGAVQITTNAFNYTYRIFFVSNGGGHCKSSPINGAGNNLREFISK